jgi:hypothetical protein
MFHFLIIDEKLKIRMNVLFHFLSIFLILNFNNLNMKNIKTILIVAQTAIIASLLGFLNSCNNSSEIMENEKNSEKHTEEALTPAHPEDMKVGFLSPTDCETAYNYALDYKKFITNPIPNPDSLYENAVIKIDTNILKQLIIKAQNSYIVAVFGRGPKPEDGKPTTKLILFPVDSLNKRVPLHATAANPNNRDVDEMYPKLFEIGEVDYKKLFNCNEKR